VKKNYCSVLFLRVFSGYLSGKEEKPKGNIWGKKMPFGICLYEHYDNSCGWVHDLAFSPSGNKLAWVSHGSCISVLDKANGSKYEACTIILNF